MKAKSLVFLALISLICGCIAIEQKNVNLSEDQIGALKEVFLKYNFEFDYETNNSSLIELRESIPSIEFDPKSLTREKQLINLRNYCTINDSIGLYFIYREIPSLLGGYEGFIGKVRHYQNENFRILQMTSTIFFVRTERGMVAQGDRIFLDYDK